MYDVQITRLRVYKVRNLKDIEIPVSEPNGKRKHLIITGRNGSGKTSLLEAISRHLDWLATQGDPKQWLHYHEVHQHQLEQAIRSGQSENEIHDIRNRTEAYRQVFAQARQGIDITLTVPLDGVLSHFQRGEFILAFYRDNRVFEAEQPKHVEKVELKDTYSINAKTVKDTPRYEFIKYLLDMKVTEALAARSQDKARQARAEKISKWFEQFDLLLEQIFNDCGGNNGSGARNVKLAFDEETYKFSILEADKEPFDFNNLSAGFAAVLDIVVDLIMRMEKHTGDVFKFDLTGIVLIDEIETHLHIELQRMILPFLTTLFPNIQFIVSTHSPMILQSIENVVIYDLENKVLVNQPQGLTDVPYNGIVESYFNTDKLSASLREKYNRFKELVGKEMITDDDITEIAELEIFLDEIPDYLAWDIATEYKRLKSEFESREDL